jgi:hypothetical protein
MSNILSAAQMSQEMRNRMMKEAIGTAFDELVTKPLQEAARLPEDIFKNMFLPYFNGEKKVEGTEILAKWYMIAGSPFQEVSVIDERNNELFRVPPIQRTSIYDPHANSDKSGNKSEMSIGEITAFAEQLSSTIPIRGVAFRERAMDSKIEQLTTVELALKDDAVRWQAIFDRYSPAAQATEVKVSGLAHIKPANSGEISYDELDF